MSTESTKSQDITDKIKKVVESDSHRPAATKVSVAVVGDS